MASRYPALVRWARKAATGGQPDRAAAPANQQTLVGAAAAARMARANMTPMPDPKPDDPAK